MSEGEAEGGENEEVGGGGDVAAAAAAVTVSRLLLAWRTGGSIERSRKGTERYRRVCFSVCVAMDSADIFFTSGF